MSAFTRTNPRLMLFSALLVALLAVFSQISLPLPLVPLNLALLVVFLIGFLLPPAWAMASMGLYLLLGLLGVPVFAGFRGGPQALFGTTGGYLMGYFLCAVVISLKKDGAVTPFGRFLLCLFALFLCYLPGTLWLMFVTGLSADKALPLAVYPFIPGDLLKCLAAALLAGRLKTAPCL